MTPLRADAGPAEATDPLLARLWAALAEIQDPELPVNLVDLGLIYGLQAQDGRVHVDLTFTAMGCPAMDMIIGDIQDRLSGEPGVGRVDVKIVWDPPWTTARLSPAGREALLAWGLSV